MEEKLQYYTLEPSLQQFYGIKVDESTKFDEETEDGTVKQHFEDLTLTTEVHRITESEDSPYRVEETSKMEVKMPVGTILIWNEQEGFILSKYKMTTLSDLESEIQEIKEVYKDSIV